jgi:hypothetical protein
MADIISMLNSLSTNYSKNSSYSYKNHIGLTKKKPVGSVIITNGDQIDPTKLANQTQASKDPVTIDLSKSRGISATSGSGYNTTINRTQLDSLITKLEELKALADTNITESNQAQILANQQEFLLTQSDVVEVDSAGAVTTTTSTVTETTVLDAIDLTGADPIIVDISSKGFDFSEGITIEAQVQLNDLSDKTLLSTDSFSLAIRNGNLEFSVTLQDGTTRTAVGPAVTANTYLHVAGTFDGTDVRAFVDGVSGTAVSASGTLAAEGNDLFFGNEAGSTNAYMADIRVFDKARTSTEISSTMNRLVDISDTDLLANYVLDSESSTIIDRKGNDVSLAGGTIVAGYTGTVETSTGIAVTGSNEVVVEQLTGGKTVVLSTSSNSFNVSLVGANGSTTTINPELNGNGQLVDPTVAGLSDGSFVFSYTQWKGAGKDIYYERYSANGVKMTAATKVNTTTADFQTEGSVTAMSDGGFVFVWESKDKGKTDIYSQRFNSAGVKVGAETRVNTTTAQNQNKPIVEALSNGGYMIAYEDDSGRDGSGTGILGRIFDSANVGGTEFVVNSTTSGTQNNVRIEQLTNGNIVVAYDDTANSGDVKARILNSSGTQVVAEFTVNPAPTAGAQSVQSMVALANGQFAISYKDDASGSSVIKAQIFNADGTRDGNVFQVSDGTSGSSDIAVNSSGELIAYYSEGGVLKTRTFTETSGTVGGSGTPDIIDNGFTTSEDVTITSTTQLALGDAELAAIASELGFEQIDDLFISNNGNAQAASDLLAQYLAEANAIKNQSLESTTMTEDIALQNLESQKRITSIGQAQQVITEVSAARENLSDMVLRSVFDLYREQSSTFLSNLAGDMLNEQPTKLEATEIEKVMFGEKTVAEHSSLKNKEGNFGSGDTVAKLIQETPLTVFDSVMKGNINGLDQQNKTK